MHVGASYRNKGVATKLMLILIEECHRRNHTEIVLETGNNEAFSASRQFYRKFGFKQCDLFGPYVGDNFSYCMRKVL